MYVHCIKRCDGLNVASSSKNQHANANFELFFFLCRSVFRKYVLRRRPYCKRYSRALASSSRPGAAHALHSPLDVGFSTSLTWSQHIQLGTCSDTL
jgi:hypothetical protein